MGKKRGGGGLAIKTFCSFFGWFDQSRKNTCRTHGQCSRTKQATKMMTSNGKGSESSARLVKRLSSLIEVMIGWWMG